MLWIRNISKFLFFFEGLAQSGRGAMKSGQVGTREEWKFTLAIARLVFYSDNLLCFLNTHVHLHYITGRSVQRAHLSTVQVQRVDLCDKGAIESRALSSS